jgi:hypothetical protein
VPAPVLVFDIETVPDVAGVRRLQGLPEHTPDADVAELAQHQRRQSAGSDFLQMHLHRVVAISCALRDAKGFHVWSLGEPTDGEGALIQRFFDGIDKLTPQLVSWNGSGFDLPVLALRGLIHGVTAPRFWEQGDEDRDFRYNNYLSRYHARHVDLMDVLSLYQGRAAAPLSQVAELAGFPGKMGMSGAKVWESWLAGDIAGIRHYCETDVANTYLIWCRYQAMRGAFDAVQLADEMALVRDALGRHAGDHWKAFVEAWRPEHP